VRDEVKGLRRALRLLCLVCLEKQRMEVRDKVKMAASLWFEGLGEACCLHRVVLLCMRSNNLLMRTGQCFLLNGFIFLGRYFLSLQSHPIFSFPHTILSILTKNQHPIL